MALIAPITTPAVHQLIGVEANFGAFNTPQTFVNVTGAFDYATGSGMAALTPTMTTSFLTPISSTHLACTNGVITHLAPNPITYDVAVSLAFTAAAGGSSDFVLSLRVLNTYDNTVIYNNRISNTADYQIVSFHKFILLYQGHTLSAYWAPVGASTDLTVTAFNLQVVGST